MDGIVDLGSQLESFVDLLVQEGRYASRDEVLRESVRALQAREGLEQRMRLETSIQETIADVDAGRVRDARDVFEALDTCYDAVESGRK